MSVADPAITGWRATLADIRAAPFFTLLALGFSSGLPLLLIFSSLSLWLREAGTSRDAVTLFSWAALGFSFKFVWAPLVDVLPVPLLTRWLGRRRAWLLLAQSAVAASLAWMGFSDPADGLVWMALAAVAIGFTAATQDIVIDAFRIECAEPKYQPILAAAYQTGYRLAMLVAGAGALKLAAGLGTSADHYTLGAWQLTYLAMAGFMAVGIVTTLITREPVFTRPLTHHYAPLDYARFMAVFALAVGAFVLVFIGAGRGGWNESADPALSFLAGAIRLASAICAALLTALIAVRLGLAPKALLREGYVAPVKDFFTRYGKAALLLLALIGLYRISDIVMGAIANIFYQDLGYTKDQIADVTKVFGLLMTIAGAFLGGIVTPRVGVLTVLFWGALLSAATNLLFAWLSHLGPSVPGLMLVVAADNLSAGLAGAAFVAYLSALTSVSFTAMQYAIFTSLMTLLPKVLAGYSGAWVNAIGYPAFFTLTAVIGIPVLGLILLCRRYAPPIKN